MERCRQHHEDCPRRLSQLGCRIILHHLFWPASEYTTPLEKKFRELKINLVPMCEYEEIILHQTTEPPPKPTETLMQYVVDHEKMRQELAARGIHKP